MSKGWRREECRARSTLECPSGHGRSQSGARRTPVGAQVTRREVLPRGEGGWEGSGWQHAPKHSRVNEFTYVKHVEQGLAPNNRITVSIS